MSVPPAPSFGERPVNEPVHSIHRVAVLGAGSWGTAFAKVLGDAGRGVLERRHGQIAAQ